MDFYIGLNPHATELIFLKPQLHIHDFGHSRATIHPDWSGLDALAWVVAAL